MIEKLQVALMEMNEFGSSLAGKLISVGSSRKRKVMLSAAAAAEDYRPKKRHCILIGREAQRAGEHHTVPMGSCHTLPKLNCLIKRDQPSPSVPTGCREIIPAFLRQLRNEDCFIKRDMPPMARSYREQFHPETNVASDHQPPKATEAAVRRRLRTSTHTRSAQAKVTDWIEACGAGAGRTSAFGERHRPRPRRGPRHSLGIRQAAGPSELTSLS